MKEHAPPVTNSTTDAIVAKQVTVWNVRVAILSSLILITVCLIRFHLFSFENEHKYHHVKSSVMTNLILSIITF